MNKRRPIQDKHERFLVDAFLSWWAAQTGEHFTVVDRPNPPEAIVQSDRRTTWVEATDTFYSEEWAEDRYSSATPGEAHKPMVSGGHISMDAQFAARFAELLQQKLSKGSYSNVYQKYGPGILLVGMQSPWFGSDTCDLMREACEGADWALDRHYFGQIFIWFPALNQQSFKEWRWDAQH